MKYLLIMLFLIPLTTYSQKVFSVKYSNQSDVKVYVVEYENQCDLKVFKVDYPNQVDGNSKNLRIFNLTPQLLNQIPQLYPLYLSVLLGLILSYELNERGCF